VLARACKAAGLEFDPSEAHTARYDAEKTADLFCLMINRWQALGGWQWPDDSSNPAEEADADG
jgi:ribonuclease T